MRGVITDSAAPGGLRLADDLPEPQPTAGELVLAVRAFSINAGETSLIEQRPDGWRPGQDTAGVVVAAAADGSGPAAGTRVVAYPEWEGWAERIPVPVNWVAPLPDAVPFEQAATRPAAGLTALRALRIGEAVLGRNVLAGAFNARVTAFISTVPEETKGADLAILARLVADGRLRPRIGWTADWTRTADAFAAMARREFRGKAVLTVPDGS
jgi:NADPH:quinone reductase